MRHRSPMTFKSEEGPNTRTQSAMREKKSTIRRVTFRTRRGTSFLAEAKFLPCVPSLSRLWKHLM